MQTRCPICLQDIEPGDTLIAEWYPDGPWWVLWHKRNGQTYCGDAAHPILNEFNTKMQAFQEGKTR